MTKDEGSSVSVKLESVTEEVSDVLKFFLNEREYENVRYLAEILDDLEQMKTRIAGRF